MNTVSVAMNKFKLIVMLMVVSVVVLLGSGVTAFANAQIMLPTSDAKSLEALNGYITNNGDRFKLERKAGSNAEAVANPFKVDSTSGVVVFDDLMFVEATDKSQKQVLKEFITAMEKSGISDQSQKKIVDEMSLANNDVSRLLIPLVIDSSSADLYSAMQTLSPAIPIIRWAFGIAAFVIVILLILSTCFDLVIIGFPIARDRIEANSEGKGNGGRIPFLTPEAQSVIKETESSVDSAGGYKNAYFMYFKRRAVSYIVLSFCLLYLVLGEMGGVISWLLTLGNGVMGDS